MKEGRLRDFMLIALSLKLGIMLASIVSVDDVAKLRRKCERLSHD